MLALFGAAQHSRFARDLLPALELGTFGHRHFRTQGAWEIADLYNYTRRSAIYTRELPAHLELDVDLSPGRHLLVLQVFNYGTGGPTRIAVEMGGQRTMFTYGGAGTDRGITTLSQPIDLTSRTSTLRLIPQAIGAKAAVIDQLQIFRLPPYTRPRNARLGGILLAVLLVAPWLLGNRRTARLSDSLGAASFCLALFVVFLHASQTPLVYPWVSSDGKLYLGLAWNLLDGTGYVDTMRQDGNILPSVGHPALLALGLALGVSPTAFLEASLLASVPLLALGLRVATGSWVAASACAVLDYAALQALNTPERAFWIGSIEGTLHLLGSLVIWSLACWRRSSFAVAWAIVTGAALLVYTLVRPMFLPLLYVAVPVMALVYLRQRSKAVRSPLVQSSAVVLVLVAAGLLATHALSYWTYRDSRMVTGTYSAIPLYCANNPYLEPERMYSTGLVARLPAAEREAFWTPLAPTDDWRVRERRLKQAVMDYVRRQPSRAARGWWWRVRQYLGASRPRLSIYPGLVLLLVAGLAMRVASAAGPGRRRAPGSGVMSRFASLGLLLAVAFFLWLGLQSLFAYVGQRSAVVGLPFLASSGVILWAEHLTSARRVLAARLAKKPRPQDVTSSASRSPIDPAG